MTRCSKIQFVCVLSAVAFSLLIAWNSTAAQDIPSNDGLTISLSTDNPIPGQVVTVSVENYGTNIDGAKISWSVNGKVVKNEIGAKAIDVTAPALGAKLNIVIVATTPDGLTISGSTVIGSGSVDMIVESDGYVPPLFRGKVPTAYQNSVKVTAVPHIADSSGKEYNANNLLYEWTKNGSVIADKSGYGKRSITLQGDIIPRAFDLSVNVSTRESGSEAIGTVNVEPQTPTISFFVNDPLYGTLFNKALTDRLSIGAQKETGVLAVPYGFNSGTKLSWSINGSARSELANKSSIILRSPSGEGGSSIVHLDISSPTNILQGASSEFTAYFGVTDTSNNNGSSI
jgi:hypothetical protein